MKCGLLINHPKSMTERKACCAAEEDARCIRAAPLVAYVGESILNGQLVSYPGLQYDLVEVQY